VHLVDQLFTGFGRGMNAKEHERKQQGERSHAASRIES